MNNPLLFPLLVSLLLVACGGGGDEQDSAVATKGPFGVGGVQLPPGGRHTIPEIKPNPIYFTNATFEDGCARPGDFEENRISFRIGDRGDGPDGRKAYYPLIQTVSISSTGLISESTYMGAAYSFRTTDGIGNFPLSRDVRRAQTNGRGHDATVLTLVARDVNHRVLGGTQISIPRAPTLRHRLEPLPGARWVESTIPATRNGREVGRTDVWSLDVVAQNIRLGNRPVGWEGAITGDDVPRFYDGDRQLRSDLSGPEQRIRITVQRSASIRERFGDTLGVTVYDSGWSPCADTNWQSGRDIFATLPDVPQTPTPIPVAACGDGRDNDGDGLIDYPRDPGCTSRTDSDERNSSLARYSAIEVTNCHSDRGVLRWYRRAFPTGRSFSSVGSLNHQYDRFGSCPRAGFDYLTINLPTAGQAYEVVAVSPSSPGCDGRPETLTCRRDSVIIQADPTAPIGGAITW